MARLDKDKYIIFLDVDSTVFDGHGVHERTVNALRRARREGHLVFLNTGRAHCILFDEFMGPVSPDGVVGSMGTGISVGDRMIYSVGMPREDVAFLMRFGETRGLRTLAESVERLVLMNIPEPLYGQDHFVRTTEEFFEKYPDMLVSKVSYMQRMEQKHVDELRERFPTSVYVHSKYTEIPATGCNKATAIARVCEHFGVGVEQTIAIGDSGNDDDMIKFAGIGVAMGNATEEIKSIADFITTDCREGGVGYAIEKLIFEGKKP